jgi:large subunit ribosomal protein L34
MDDLPFFLFGHQKDTNRQLTPVSQCRRNSRLTTSQRSSLSSRTLSFQSQRASLHQPPHNSLSWTSSHTCPSSLLLSGADNRAPSLLRAVRMRQPSANRTFSSSVSLSAPRKTFRPSRRVQKRRHGFLARLRTRTGQAILKRRRAKGRKYLSW